MTESHPFSQPTRQSSAAIIFILGGVLKMLVRQLWVVILVFVFNKKSNFDTYTFIFIGLAIFTAAMSLLNYFNLYFYIKDGELVLEKGVLRKSKINVPLDRVQTVNFRQNVVHQLFNVVAVDIDTAGSAGKEFSLHAISKPDAELLRDVVGRRQKEVGSSTVGSWQSNLAGDEWESNGAEALPHSEIRNPQSEIFRLRPLDLVKIGASQNHLRTAGILMAFVISFADDVEQALGLDFEKRMTWWLGTTDGSDLLSWLLVGVPFLLFISFFWHVGPHGAAVL
ncbi:MAG: PH domain-containing protein [Saprospiraceae bacterium]|nr:PH domain-containing protein [Saprospiraceae bacterium]